MSLYLDHNASALPSPAAARAAAAWLIEGAGNPSSVHHVGRRARAAVETARRQVAEAMGVPPREVVFTSGATEALHLAIVGTLQPGDHVVASAVEHPAVFGALRVAGAEVTRVPVDATGGLEPEAFAAACHAGTTLVIAMAAQNEIGAVYPVEAIAAAVAPAPLLCDGVQAFGKVTFAPQAWGCAMAVVSAHKIGGPIGAGALWRRPDVALRAILGGGPQERGLRAGTENVAGLIGFGVAASEVPARLAQAETLAARREALVAGLADLPGFTRHGTPGLPNTVSFRLDGVDGDLLLSALDLEQIAVSSGSACSAGAIEPSPVLLALGLTPEQARGGVRVSLGPETTDADVHHFVAVFRRVAGRILERERRCA